MTKKYLPRIIDNELDKLLSNFGAVLIVGPKWCGKTTTAGQKAKSILKMQDPDKINSYMQTIDVKPSLLLLGDKPRLIDEWQVAPVLWDSIRNSVDEIGENGLYILTGSTSVDFSKTKHSGTGRIAKLKMSPMSLYESNESNGLISLGRLFNDTDFVIDGLKSNLTIEQLVSVSCRGGWPSAVINNSDNDYLTAKYYLENIIDNDCKSVDGVKRNSKRMRNVLQSYARNVSTLATDSTILKDICSNDSTMDARTLNSYLYALEKLYVIDEINAWNPNIRSASAIRSSNKREFVDPSIAVAALGLTKDELLQDFNTFGFIFENLCFRDLKAYSLNLGGQLSYYHDKYGLEADCVLHLNDGRYALVEFKLGSKQIDDGAKHLLKIKELISNKCSEVTSSLKEPNLLLIITGGEMAYTRNDGVKVIPIGCLKD